jgi:hypothetical protein
MVGNCPARRGYARTRFLAEIVYTVKVNRV